MANPILTIPHPSPLIPGVLLRRYKRFLADVELGDGSLITAHCVNTGRMEGLTMPGLRVWLSHEPSPTRKLAYTWQLTEFPEGLVVGTNTAAPNRIVGELLRRRLLPGLDWDECVPERRYGERSRVDFWLNQGGREHFVEVKNCHLTYPDGFGYFPDSVSERATKHLAELEEVVAHGHRATVIFTAQRIDTKTLRPSDVHDPAFAAAARTAASKGVRFMALRIEPKPDAYVIHEVIPVELTPYDTTGPLGWMQANRQAAAPI